MSDERPFSAPPEKRYAEDKKIIELKKEILTDFHINSEEFKKRIFKEPIIFKNVFINTFTLSNGSFDTSKLINNCFKNQKNLVEKIDEDYPHSFSTEYRGISRTNTPIGNEPLLSKINVNLDIREELMNFVLNNNIPIIDDLCVTLCKDQEGSRFLQKKLETFNSEEYLWFFNSIKMRIVDLSIDLFGNYVIQKMFETANVVEDVKFNGNSRNKIVDEMVELLKGKVLILSLHMYGCRVIQKALECVDNPTPIVQELKDDITTLIEDQNGNHVVQKCVERVSDREFLINEFENNYLYLCNHKYGCRVIQRLFEACDLENKDNGLECENLISIIIMEYQKLIINQYGNYVLQHIIEKNPKKKILALKILQNSINYSQHKFASNVVEKCVAVLPQEYFKEFIKNDSFGRPFLVSMSTDKFANYVVQRIYEFLDSSDKRNFKDILLKYLGELKTNSYAKHIISKILC